MPPEFEFTKALNIAVVAKDNGAGIDQVGDDWLHLIGVETPR